MIELFGTMFGLAKDVVAYLSWDEESKVVDGDWLEKSGFLKKMEQESFKLYWSKPEKIESRKLDGYEVIYEIDKLRRVRKTIIWSNGRDSLTLLGKKEAK